LAARRRIAAVPAARTYETITSWLRRWPRGILTDVIEQPDRAERPGLSDRMAYLLVLRLGFAGIVLGWSTFGPGLFAPPLVAVLSITATYLLSALFAEWARRLTRGGDLVLLSGLLLLDGVYLAYAMYATGGLESPLRLLVCLHLVAVSLLASSATGLKVALWHSVLLITVLAAQPADVLPSIGPSLGNGSSELAVVTLVAFWLFAVVASVLAAVNQREMGRRVADLQALVDIGAGWQLGADRSRSAGVILDALAERVGFSRGLLLGVTDGRVAILAAHGAAEIPTAAVDPDAVIEKAWEWREPIRVRRLDPAHNQLLCWALPNARNLLVAPMVADERAVGAIVIEHRSRLRVGTERRVMAILGQYASMAPAHLRAASMQMPSPR